MQVTLQPKVALIHDYLKEYGGAERVLETLHEIYPDAPIYVAYLNLGGLGKHQSRIKDWDIRTSFMQKIPFISKLLSPLKFLAPLAFEKFNLKEYDLVISSSAAYYSKAVITKPESLHISYIHTPPRYLYGYTTAFDLNKNIIVKFFATILNHFMRIYDFEISQRPDILVANSKNVAQRIEKFYRRKAVIIYPPVDIEKFKVKGDGEYFLAPGRLERHKRIDLIIRVFNKLGVHLKVSGTGVEMSRLKKIASKNIEFLGEIEEEKLANLYANAKAVIVATEDEDFGIVPVEAQAAGTPVIAIKEGGFLETIIEGESGEFFETEEQLAEVVSSFDPKKYQVEDLRKNAERFSKERFKKEILDLVEKNLK